MKLASRSISVSRSTTRIPSRASTIVLVSDASARDAIAVPDAIVLDLGRERLVPVGVPKADPDAGTCVPRTDGFVSSIVCFGSDPTPYQLYLQPGDGGVVPGQCPGMRDFMHSGGESCGYVGCGPLLGSAVSDLMDGGTAGADAGTDCCYFVTLVCGV